MTFARKNLGQQGEDEAAAELLSRGYEIVGRNCTNKIGEIDIIAKDGGVLCFIEVKTKTNSLFGTPEDMVGKKKQLKILKTAELYLLENNLQNIDWRIDVVAVDYEKEEIRVIKNITGL